MPFNCSVEFFPMSLCREIPRRSRCQSRRALALDLPPAFKSRRVNQLSSHPRTPRPDFTEMNSKERGKGAAEERRKREREKGRCRLMISAIFSPWYLVLFWRERGTRESKKHLGRGHTRTTLFSRSNTHVLSRSPGSRDERALRASLKAAPDSKPRPSPATLAPGPPPLFPFHPLSSPYFSLDLPFVLATFSLRLFLSLFFVSPLLEFYLRLAILLCLLCSISVFSLSSSFSTPVLLHPKCCPRHTLNFG